MAFRDLDEFLTVKPLVLPIRGKEYAFPGDLSGESWLRLQVVGDRMRGGADGFVAVSDTDEVALRAEMFGGVDAEMIADGCTSAQMQAVFVTLVTYHLSGRNLAAAEAAWDAQGEAPAPNREARRSKAPAKSNPARGSRAGSTHPRPKVAAPPGTPSSNAGD